MFFLYFWALWVALQAFYHLIDLAQFAWYTNALRTMRLALATLNAMIRLTIAWNNSIERDEILAAMLAIIAIPYPHWQRPLVLALVVMHKDGRDIYAIRTRHTVFTVVAWDILKTNNLLGNILIEESHLLLR